MQLGTPDRPRRRLFAPLLWILIAALGAFVALATLRLGAAPSISIEPKIPGIGKRTPIVVRVAAPGRGLGPVKVELVQDQLDVVLAQRELRPRPFWKFWGPRTERAEIAVEAGRETIAGLRAGEATIRVTAERASTPLRHPAPTVVERKLPVRLQPPALQVTSHRTYVAQGGCEAVVYHVGPSAVRSGVEVGDWFFPGYPLPGGGAQDRFAFFAVPYDVDSDATVRLVASDEVGNQAEARFVEQFFPRPPKSDTIKLTDDFLSRVVPQIMGETPSLKDKGNLLDNYLEINGELRRENAQALRELATKSRREFLWRAPFLPLPNGKVMSHFADRRTYLYEGRIVDHQDHLGFDLASVEKAPVPAANRGVVVLAHFFGIYGNAVVIDHGYGLMTLYAHLSSIDVKEGQEVERGAILGRSGATGLAGGDHLHFTTLLDGLPVNPVEWWDPHWLQDRLAAKLGPALPLQVTPAAPAAPAKRHRKPR
ncbi:MAG: M23 family metallopeptidase [Acidobacteriota bacterium]